MKFQLNNSCKIACNRVASFLLQPEANVFHAHLLHKDSEVCNKILILSDIGKLRTFCARLNSTRRSAL